MTTQQGSSTNPENNGEGKKVITPAAIWKRIKEDPLPTIGTELKKHITQIEYTVWSFTY